MTSFARTTGFVGVLSSLLWALPCLTTMTGCGSGSSSESTRSPTAAKASTGGDEVSDASAGGPVEGNSANRNSADRGAGHSPSADGSGSAGIAEGGTSVGGNSIVASDDVFTQPPPVSADELNERRVPDGTADELFEFVDRMESKIRGVDTQARLTRMSREEYDRQVTGIVETKLQAIEKVLGMPDLTPEQRRSAVRILLESLTHLANIQRERVPELRKAAESFASDPDTVVACNAHMTLLLLGVEDVVSGNVADSTVLDASFGKIVSSRQITSQDFVTLCQGFGLMYEQEQHRGAAVRYLGQLASAFKGSDDSELAQGAAHLQAQLQAVNFEPLLKDVVDGKPGSAETLTRAAEQFVTQDPSRAAYGMISGFASNLLEQNKTAAAKSLMAVLYRAFSGSDDEELADSASFLAVQAPMLDVMHEVPGGEQALQQAAARYVATKQTKTRCHALMDLATQLERMGRIDVAKPLLDLVGQSFIRHPDKDLVAEVVAELDKANRRISLVGNRIELEGVGLDGTPLRWSDYRGKVVLIDFWATWCVPCLHEFPNLKRNYEKYRARGFEIIGVNLDEDPQEAVAHLQREPLPWRTIVSTDPQARGFANPNAVRFGITSIPFMVLVGPDGVVQAIHARGQQLDDRLAQLFPESGRQPNVSPDVGPNAAPGRGPAPPSGGGASTIKRRAGARLVAFLSGGPSNTGDDAPRAEQEQDGTPTVRGDKVESRVTDKAEREEQEQQEDILANVNPYAPREDLSVIELIDFLFDMREKPDSIRRRPGFSDAIVMASDRILAESDNEKYQAIAATEKLGVLHADACLGNDDADKRLMRFVDRLKDDTRPRIAQEVAFLRLEREAIDVDELPIDKLPDLLERLAKFFETEELTVRHLRIASSTVHAINRIEDGDRREELFRRFGDLFAKSGEKQLAGYGKKIAKTKSADSTDLVGKPLELTGVTLAGNAFQWESYRGKVVLVDFWATWCGPCLREMPHVKALRDRLRDKGFEVVGISLDDDQEALAKYVEENQIAWETLAGEETKGLATKYGVSAIPTMMLVDRNGKVIGVSHQLAELAPQAEKLLGN